MLVHIVLFWLKKDLSDADKKAFYVGLESLKGIASTENVYIGTPADTERPVIDKSYDYCLTVLLKSMAEHDAYQVDPLSPIVLKVDSGILCELQIAGDAPNR